MNKCICKNCGKEFNGKLKDSKFCCFECYKEYVKSHPKEKSNKNKVKVICAYCGKEEYVTKTRAKKYNCCSLKCMGKFNSIKYNEKLVKTCPICNKDFYVQRSKFDKRLCCSKECLYKYKSIHEKNENNPNCKVRIIELENGVKTKEYNRYKYPYHKISLDVLKIDKIPKGYDIHHKDSNPKNNDVTNLVILPRSTHMLLHRFFGNILLNAVQNGKISLDIFYSLCTEEQKDLYKNIIDLNITNQIVSENIINDLESNPYKVILNNN